MDRLTEWAERHTIKKIQDAIYYISEGIPKKRALEKVLEKSVLGQKYKDRVIAEVTAFAE